MMQNIFQKIRSFVAQHKIWSSILVILFVGGVWWIWSGTKSTSANTRYVMGSVTRSTIIASVTASGQVTADQNLDIKPQVSGKVISLNVTPGQKVQAGTLLAVLDPTDAQKSVRDAQANLQSAKISLQKLQQPATTLTVTQQQNAVSQAENALASQYQSSYSDVTSTFLDLPTVILGLKTIDLGTDASTQNTQQNIDYYRDQAAHFDASATQYRDAAFNDYNAARASYDQTLSDFKALGPTPDSQTIERILQETYTTTGLLATAAKSSYNLIQFYSDQVTQHNATPKALATSQIADLTSYQTKLQSHLSQLLTDKTNLTNAKSNIVEHQQTLDQTNAGADALDVQSAQLTVTQRQNALADATASLADYYIRAPFAGLVASVGIQKYDQASSGSTIATIVTSAQVATLSLNEVDASKIALQNKATLTFDALPDTQLTGSVVEIDPVGAVSQGVVSYTVKISFDSQKTEIKPGMTVTATIQTEVHTDALVVPQSAIKTVNGQKYIQVFVPAIASSTITLGGSLGVTSKSAPEQVPVEVGLSDDSNTEIISGVTEGEQLVTRTMTGTTATAARSTTTGTSRSGTGLGGGAPGGGIRIP